MKYILFAGLLFSTINARAQQFPDSGAVTTTVVNPASVRVVQKLGEQVPQTPVLREMEGSEITFGQLDSRRPVVVLPLFYRCHGVCSLEFENLISALNKLKPLQVGRDFDVIVLGIDPTEGADLAKSKFDEAKQEFPALMANPGWHFLTGDLTNIREVTDALGFYFLYDAQKDLINHPSGLMFLSPNGRISSYILSPQYSSQALEHGIRLASQSEVGPKVQDAFFGCVHIDPLTGKRSLVLEKVLRLAGIAFLFIAVGGIALLSRKGHASKPL